MARESKVVSLHRHNVGLNSLPMPLIRLRDRSAGRLQMLLGAFFDEADDALFGMSDKAGSTIEQTAYFDAMRELRLQRKSLTLSFLQWVGQAFNEIGRVDSKRQPAGHLESASDIQTLSLLDDSALEEQVALDNMIAKVRNHYNEQILLLHARIEHLIAAESLPVDRNPLGPEVICRGLGEACADLDVDIRAKLAIFKLFDKLLIGRLGPFYEEANRELVQDGILPELRRPAALGAGNNRSPLHQSIPLSQAGLPNGSAHSGSEETAGTSTFAQLSELLHRSAANTDFPTANTENSIELSTGGLLQLLGDVQDELRGTSTRTPAGTDLQKLVGRLLADQNGEIGRVSQVDADVISLVSMLFDFILEDRQLPGTMKILLARLQLPILRVALQDRSFFDRGGHPARKLLNEMALGAVGWVEKKENQQDPLREKIESIIERFSTEFDRDIELIQDLLGDFQHFMDLDRRRALVEQRFWDAEAGRSRSQKAKAAAAEIIACSRDGHQVPEAMSTLIDAWSKVLHWLFLREGESGERWKRAVATTDLLIWTLDPHPINGNTRAALLKAAPQVVDAVRDGLQTIGWDLFATDKLIRDLEGVHLEVLRSIDFLAEDPALAAPARLEQVTAPESGSPQLEPVPIPSGPALLHAEPEVEALAESEPLTGAESGTNPSIEIEAPAGPAGCIGTEPSRSESVASTASILESCASETWIQHAEGLRVGSWLELQDGEDRKLRCKLAAVIKATGKYILVNRNGAKVAEYPLSEMALALAEGRLTMLDDGLIFDRALESVIGNLRSNRRD